MKTHFTFCLFFAFCLGAVITTKAQVDVNDSLALVDLYNSTNGPGWYHHDNWLTGPVKTWYGILMTGSSRNGNEVKTIKLPGNNLTGVIPSSLANVSNLQYLWLNDNQLSGNIPPELGNLSNLSFLFLAYNQLSGPIPSELGNLSNLSKLTLNRNQLSGTIPPALGKLSSAVLNLSYNQLSGLIPRELGNHTGLETLDLSHNQLSGNIPPELGNFTNLHVLDLSYNQLSGNIPPELGNLSVYYYAKLDLSNNQLSGNIPPELGDLSNLGYLQLNNNQLNGNIPASLFKILSLVRLSYNKLEGPIPEIGNSYVNGLFLDHNKLSGPIPASIANITGLHYLDLSYNQLSGTTSSIANLNYLYSLDLSHNKFTFDGMELIAQKFSFAIYDWQAPIPLHVSSNTLSISAGGTLSNNAYVWYKQDKPGNTTIKGDSVFHPTESGVYFVKVRNKIATGLKLVSRAVKYTAPSSLNGIASNKQQEFLNNSFSVYPNPAKNVLHVTTNGNASFSLMSEDGKIILTSTIDKAGTINISNVAAGVYYLKNNNTNAVQKIAIVR
jgi:Leucine-rich repeat (LRR) protein